MSVPIVVRSAAKATAFVLVGVGAAPAMAEEITVFAAASLTNAMAEVERRFEADSGHEITVSLAGSSALARQIQRGAPADIFISANPGWMDALAQDGLLEPGTRVDLLTNSIVLVAHGPDAAPVDIGPDMDLVGLLDDGRLAMALVDAVPAGIYGKAALETLGVWADVQPRVAQTNNVRAALALVALGEAPYGIVYATDAVAEDGVTAVGTFPADTHPPIVYPAAGIAGNTGPATTAFLSFLGGPAARAVFEDEGFGMAGE